MCPPAAALSPAGVPREALQLLVKEIALNAEALAAYIALAGRVSGLQYHRHPRQ